MQKPAVEKGCMYGKVYALTGSNQCLVANKHIASDPGSTHFHNKVKT